MLAYLSTSLYKHVLNTDWCNNSSLHEESQDEVFAHNWITARNFIPTIIYSGNSNDNNDDKKWTNFQGYTLYIWCFIYRAFIYIVCGFIKWIYVGIHKINNIYLTLLFYFISVKVSSSELNNNNDNSNTNNNNNKKYTFRSMYIYINFRSVVVTGDTSGVI